ncbi:Per1-like family protein [Actinidia rufa]|uniref:Post-GPI attachment to proteins factor 3 n=1 Tax=Actinidia rufa TaxID=165716 RepID=A0A7J0E9V1_9ERIC|nr:Per1-like family protein [Actinidia rufa]
MESPLMVRGICKNHSISIGNYGTAAATADTTVCLLERKRERKTWWQACQVSWKMAIPACLWDPGAHFGRALSALNLAMQFQGWVSFFILVNYKFPLRPNKRTYYEYMGLLHMYALLARTPGSGVLFSTVEVRVTGLNLLCFSINKIGLQLHSQHASLDVDLTEKLYYSSAMALIGFSLILAILRAVNVRDEAARVMVAAPLIAFATTHILYLNFYQLDYGKA